MTVVGKFTTINKRPRYALIQIAAEVSRRKLQNVALLHRLHCSCAPSTVRLNIPIGHVTLLRFSLPAPAVSSHRMHRCVRPNVCGTEPASYHATQQAFLEAHEVAFQFF